MLTRALKNILVLLSVLLLILGSYGISRAQTEEDLIQKAQTFYADQNYQEALPLYAQLLSVHPQNPEYNYKFGVCTLYGDRSDRRRPIRYLTIALRSIKDDPKLHYYLGLAYYQNQEFADAMKYLNLYLAKLGSDSPERPGILEKVNACLNGMNLEHKNIISEIVSTSEFTTENFHRAYKANEFDGMLILKPDMFITSQEKKKNENAYVFIPQIRKYLYYSGYDGSNDQRDLFVVEMTAEGDWSEPKKLPESINTSFDEDYPIAIDGGLTLYFCSKGHNSLGGFDVYKSTFDTVSGVFSDPENLGVGINSPFDDIMFIPDRTGNFAYFSTDRDNLNGTINVYKIRLIDEALNQDQFLAENVIESNLGQSIHNQPQQAVQQTNIAPATSQKPKQQIAAATKSSTELSPSERAAKMKNERSIMTKYADTSYRLLTQTKALIRDLTNKRDRANTVSQKKEEAAKTLEVKFAEMTHTMAEVESEVEFDKMLENALVLKQEIYQYRQRADRANLVAWNLGKQLKIKNQELESIKASAGQVQSNSVSGNMEGTRLAYLELKSDFNLADTLTDYSDALFALSSDEMTFDVPATELAFAENMRKGFQNKSLLAQSNQKPAQEDIPIVVVDKRSSVAAQKPAKPKVVVLPLIESVAVPALAFADMVVDEEQLELSFSVDAITPFKLVESVNHNFLAQQFEVDETELEINLQMDLPEVLPTVEPVSFAALDILPEDEPIEINTAIDVIQPIELVQQVETASLYAEITIEEASLEIDSSIDAIVPIDLVQPVFANAEIDLNPDEQDLEISFGVDAILPEGVVEPVYFLAENELEINEQLEINQLIDAIEPYQLIETVQVDMLATALEIDETELEIQFGVDAILPEGVVEPVFAMFDEPVLENEIDLEINHDIDAIDAIAQVEYVNTDFSQSEFVLAEEELEINLQQDALEALAQIKQITFDEQAYAVAEPDEEILEISIEEAYLKLNEPVEQIHITEFATVFPADEELEISEDIVQPMNIVSPVYSQEFAVMQPDEVELEIRFDRYEQAVISVPKQVEPVSFASRKSVEIEPDEEDIVINFGIDQYQNEMLMASADNSANITERVDEIPEMPSISTDVFYLRESVSLSHEIETSRTDMEVLRTALTNPSDLEYEELLFAASLTSNPLDQIRIYRIAFIHLDRDWRAFNNAAVTSMNTRELNQAEVFLYQASLLSQDNGKIYNNMGILACYQSHFDKARDYFVTALQLGVNTEYNLSVLKTMTESNSFTSEQLHQEIGEHKYFEVLGDVMNYGSDN